jgi:NitT/TauT family transport system substrate-binding protein
MAIKRLLSLILSLALAGTLAGCVGGGSSSSESAAPEEAPSVSEAPPEETTPPTVEAEPVAQDDAPIEADGSADGVEVRIGGLIGPTGMGMAYLMEMDDQGATPTKYEFTLSDAPDKVSPLLINGELDIAALPVNMASILHNKTEGEIEILAVNTLGVLYVLTKDETVASVADLKGKTIYATGQGATPEYVLRYILSQNGIDPENDVTIEFKSEHAELATLIAAGQAPIAVLPEPFVTNVVTKDPSITIALDLTKEWEAATGGAVQTTGCIVARKEFVEAHPQVVAEFLGEYQKSAEYAAGQIDEAAALMEKFGIIPKAAVAKQAIPRCNIVYLAGSEMKTAVSKYLEVLFEANPQSVGGTLPDDSFYYAG